MECKHAALNASADAVNPSRRAPSVAVISSRKPRRLQAGPVSNASPYRYRRRVFEKRTQETYCRQLQRITQATAVAPLGSDPLAVVVIEVEIPRQFIGGKRLRISAVAFPLCGGQKADRHGINVLRCRRWRYSYPLKSFRFEHEILSVRGSSSGHLRRRPRLDTDQGRWRLIKMVRYIYRSTPLNRTLSAWPKP